MGKFVFVVLCCDRIGKTVKIVFEPPPKKKRGGQSGPTACYLVTGIKILYFFRSKEFVTTMDLMTEFHMNYKTAKMDMMKLRLAGIIKKLPHGSGGRFDKYVLEEAYR